MITILSSNKNQVIAQWRLSGILHSGEYELRDAVNIMVNKSKFCLCVWRDKTCWNLSCELLKCLWKCQPEQKAVNSHLILSTLSCSLYDCNHISWTQRVFSRNKCSLSQRKAECTQTSWAKTYTLLLVCVLSFLMSFDEIYIVVKQVIVR